MRSRYGPWFQSNDSAAGGGVGGAGGGSAADVNRDALAATLAARHGDALKALGVVLGENFEYREQIRKFKENPGLLFAENTLSDGRRLISKDEFAELTSFRALGKPDVVKDQLDKGQLAAQGLEKIEFDKLVESAAKTLDFSAEVLIPLARTNQLKFEVRKENTTTDGETKQVDVAYVRGPGSNDPWTKLSEYAEASLKPFLPALKVKVTEDAGEDGEAQGSRWPNQRASAGRGPLPKDAVAAHVAGNYSFPGKEKAAAK